MKFDISPIPENAVITSVKLHCYSTDTNYPWWSITPISNDPVSTDASTLNTDILDEANSGYYDIITNEDPVLGWKEYSLTGTVNTDLQAALSSNWFAIGLASRDTGTNYFVDFDGWGQVHHPYLEVQYTLNQSESWLTLDSGTSTSGTVQNSTPINIDVGFNSSGLSDGDYSANIKITSNDLADPEINIPVNLTVGNPQIYVSETQLDFGNVEVGYSSVLQFYIENTGTLALTGDITTPTDFTVAEVIRSSMLDDNKKRKTVASRNVLNYSLEPSETVTYNLTFSPLSATDYDDFVVITHNAVGSDKQINVIGTGAVADIDYTESSYSQTMASDNTDTDDLTIGNLGNATLTYTASISYSRRNFNTSPKITEENYIKYDPDDYPSPIRQGGEDIASAFYVSSLPFNDTGTTTGYNDDYDEVCPYSGSTSPDVVRSLNILSIL